MRDLNLEYLFREKKRSKTENSVAEQLWKKLVARVQE